MKNVLTGLAIYLLCVSPSIAQDSGSGFDITGLGGTLAPELPPMRSFARPVATPIAPSEFPTSSLAPALPPMRSFATPVAAPIAQEIAPTSSLAPALPPLQSYATAVAAPLIPTANPWPNYVAPVVMQAAQAVLQGQAQQYMSIPLNTTGQGIGLPVGLPYTSTSGLIINTVNCATCRENGVVDTTLFGAASPASTGTSGANGIIPTMPNIGGALQNAMPNPPATPASGAVSGTPNEIPFDSPNVD